MIGPRGRAIEEVGRRLGFTEGQSFTRWFRRHAGQAPRAYREGAAATPAAGLVQADLSR